MQLWLLAQGMEMGCLEGGVELIYHKIFSLQTQDTASSLHLFSALLEYPESLGFMALKSLAQPFLCDFPDSCGLLSLSGRATSPLPRCFHIPHAYG